MRWPGSPRASGLGTRAAVGIEWAPGWVGALAGGLIGVIVGWGCVRLLLTGWRRWRRPVAAWLATRCLAARRRLTRWTTARGWRAGRRARVDYQPFPQHAPALTRGGADLAEPPAPHSPLFGDPDA